MRRSFVVSTVILCWSVDSCAGAIPSSMSSHGPSRKGQPVGNELQSTSTYDGQHSRQELDICVHSHGEDCPPSDISDNKCDDWTSYVYEMSVWSTLTIKAWSKTSSSTGSGVFWPNWHMRPFIMTNFHVIDGADSIEAHFSYKSQRPEEYVASLVSIDHSRDLALLELEDWSQQSSVLRPAKLGDSSLLRPLEQVVLMGTPLGRYANSGSVGRIANLDHSCEFAAKFYTPCLQISDPMAVPGYSGGAYRNSRGEVVGIPTKIEQKAENSEKKTPLGNSVGGRIGSPMMFAVPSNIANKSFTLMLMRDQVTVGGLGISVYSLEEVEASIVSYVREWMAEMPVPEMKRGSNYKERGMIQLKYMFPIAKLLHQGVIVKSVGPSGPSAQAGLTLAGAAKNLTTCCFRSGDHIRLNHMFPASDRKLFDDGIITHVVSDDSVIVDWDLEISRHSKLADPGDLALHSGLRVVVKFCGHAAMNGEYISRGFRDKKHSFEKVGDTSAKLYFNEAANQWRFYNSSEADSGKTLYQSRQNTALPPSEGWEALGGSLPVPSVAISANCRPKVGERVKFLPGHRLEGNSNVSLVKDDGSSTPFQLSHHISWHTEVEVRKHDHDFGLSDIVRRKLDNVSGIVVGCSDDGETVSYLVRPCDCAGGNATWHSSAEIAHHSVGSGKSLDKRHFVLCKVSAVNGRSVENVQGLSAAEYQHQPGEEVNLTIARVYRVKPGVKPVDLVLEYLQAAQGKQDPEEVVSRVFEELYVVEQEHLTVVLGNLAARTLQGEKRNDQLVQGGHHWYTRNTFVEVAQPNNSTEHEQRSQSSPPSISRTAAAWSEDPTSDPVPDLQETHSHQRADIPHGQTDAAPQPDEDRGTCTPCKFHHGKDGCKNGEHCSFSHINTSGSGELGTRPYKKKRHLRRRWCKEQRKNEDGVSSKCNGTIPEEKGNKANAANRNNAAFQPLDETLQQEFQ